MFSISRLKSVMTAALIAFASLSTGADAAGPSTKVVVPDRPGNGGISIGSCYQVAERLYGPYSMSFCLSGRGTYKVTGGGLTCNGGLSWSNSGKSIAISLRRTSCGRGQAWSADSISCSVVGFLGAVLPKVIIPDHPGLPGFGDLRCTYTPSVKGYKPMQIRAHRV